MISQFTGRMARLRTSARMSPASRPDRTISSESTMVRTVPSRMSGRYFAMTLALKKVSTNLSQRVMRSVTLNLPDEGARALVRRALEDLHRRSLLHDQPVVHENHAVGGGASEAHLVADHDHGHAAFAQAAPDRQHRADQPRIPGPGPPREQHDAG